MYELLKFVLKLLNCICCVLQRQQLCQPNIAICINCSKIIALNCYAISIKVGTTKKSLTKGVPSRSQCECVITQCGIFSELKTSCIHNDISKAMSSSKCALSATFNAGEQCYTTESQIKST